MKTKVCNWKPSFCKVRGCQIGLKKCKKTITVRPRRKKNKHRKVKIKDL